MKSSAKTILYFFFFYVKKSDSCNRKLPWNSWSTKINKSCNAAWKIIRSKKFGTGSWTTVTFKNPSKRVLIGCWKHPWGKVKDPGWRFLVKGSDKVFEGFHFIFQHSAKAWQQIQSKPTWKWHEGFFDKPKNSLTNWNSKYQNWNIIFRLLLISLMKIFSWHKTCLKRLTSNRHGFRALWMMLYFNRLHIYSQKL